MATWTITRTRGDDSVTKSLTSWGISKPVIEEQSLAVSNLTFVIKKLNILDDPPFAFGDLISLKEDGVQRFYGRMKRLPSIARGGKNAEEYNKFLVADPWDDLTRLNYIQPRQIANITAESVVDYSAVDTSQVTLGAQATTGDLISFGDQISAIVAFAVHYGAILQQGTIPTFRTIPIDVGRDITCAESIKRCLAYQPDAVGWLDYSTTPPSLNIKARSTLTAVDIDFIGANAIREVDITSRLDLVPRGIVFNYMTTKEVTEGTGDDAVVRTVDVPTPDAAGPAFAVVDGVQVGGGFGLDVPMATIELSRTSAGVYEDAPIGLADYYYQQLAVPHYEGTFMLKGLEVPMDVGLGNVFNFTNGRAQWLAMKALIQSVKIDIEACTAEFDFGPWAYLGAKDFVDLLMFNRRSQIPNPKSNFPGVQPPANPANPSPKPGGPANPGGGNSKPTPITVCEDGVPKTINVLTG